MDEKRLEDSSEEKDPVCKYKKICMKRGETPRTLWRQEAMLRPHRKKGLEKSFCESVHVVMFIETWILAWLQEIP